MIRKCWKKLEIFSCKKIWISLFTYHSFWQHNMQIHWILEILPKFNIVLGSRSTIHYCLGISIIGSLQETCNIEIVCFTKIRAKASLGIPDFSYIRSRLQIRWIQTCRLVSRIERCTKLILENCRTDKIKTLAKSTEKEQLQNFRVMEE